MSIILKGETEAWSACFLAVLGPLGAESFEPGAAADAAEKFADAAVSVLKRREAARVDAQDAELTRAQALARGRTYCREDRTCPTSLSEIWTIHSITGQHAFLRRPTRRHEPRMHYETSANVFALANCTADDPDEDTGFMPCPLAPEGRAVWVPMGATAALVSGATPKESPADVELRARFIAELHATGARDAARMVADPSVVLRSFAIGLSTTRAWALLSDGLRADLGEPFRCASAAPEGTR